MFLLKTKTLDFAGVTENLRKV